MLGGGAFLPVHWGAVSLAMHAWDEPVDTLLAHAPSRDVLLMSRLGEAVKPWWRQVDPGQSPTEVATPAVTPVPTMAARERDLPLPLD